MLPAENIIVKNIVWSQQTKEIVNKHVKYIKRILKCKEKADEKQKLLEKERNKKEEILNINYFKF